jgi:hypothetical protein
MASTLLRHMIPRSYWSLYCNGKPLLDPLADVWHRYNYESYLQERDQYRIQANKEPYWVGTDLEFAVKCAPGTSSYISRKRNIISLYDKAVHGRNMAKQKNVDENHHKCSFCGTLDSQRHLLLECKDPDLILMRERTFDTFHRELDSVLHHQDKWHSIFYSLARLAWSLDTPDLERFWLGTYNHQTWSRLCGDEDHHI